MKEKRALGNIFFWLTLVSPMISFSLACIIGEADIFDVAGIIRYSWVMLLFIPIGVLSIFIGLLLKKDKQKYKKNLIIAFVCLPLLIIFGSYRFIFTNVSYDVDRISIVEDTTNTELPNEIKAATIKYDLYNVSYAKITDSESKETFEQQIVNNHLWQDKLNSAFKSLLPLDIQYESFDYFVFYNTASNEYNVFPQSGQYECIFVAYDCDLQRLIILDDYKVDVN